MLVSLVIRAVSSTFANGQLSNPAALAITPARDAPAIFAIRVTSAGADRAREKWRGMC
jgi:hypothetical protein